MANKKAKSKKGAVAPGTFQPAMPSEPIGVLRLFAIAGRAVCADPTQLGPVTQTLGTMIAALTAPERTVAEDCAPLWALFARMAAQSKPALMHEGARAFYRDLDAVAQRYDLPPLDSWSALPEFLVEPNPIAVDQDTTDVGEDLDSVRLKARALAKRRKGALKVADVVELVGSLSDGGREALYAALVGGGVVGKADVALLEQTRRRGEKVTGSGHAAWSTLLAVGAWLAG